MNAAREFVAGRGAVPIREVASWLSRSVAHVYGAIGRGELRKAGQGRVTADSVIEFYDEFEKGGGASQVTTSTPATRHGNKQRVSEKTTGLRGEAGAALLAKGGAS